MSDNLKTAGIISLAAVFFIVDRAFKWLFINDWSRADFKIIGDWFRLRLSVNQGIAFSLPFNFDLIIILTCLALLMLVYIAWRSCVDRRWPIFASLSFVIAGAYSNLLDRLIFHGVIDYFSLTHFSVFNLADAMIVGGLAAIIFFSRKSKRRAQDNLESRR